MIGANPCRGYGSDLTKVREAKSMSVEQVAFLLGQDVSFVERLESEKIYPSSHLMKKLSELYHVELELVSGRIWCDTPGDCSTLS